MKHDRSSAEELALFCYLTKYSKRAKKLYDLQQKLWELNSEKLKHTWDYLISRRGEVWLKLMRGLPDGLVVIAMTDYCTLYEQFFGAKNDTES